MSPLLWLLLLALGAFGLRTAVNTEGPMLLRLLSGTATSKDGPLLLLGLIAPLVVWITAFLIVVCDSDDLSGKNLPATPFLRIAIICGLAGFLLHNQITFAVLDSGGGTLFWIFAAFAVAMCPSMSRENYHLARLDRYLVVILMVVGLVGFIRIVFTPAASEQLRLREAMQAYRSGRSPKIVEAMLNRAARALPSDPWPHAFSARVLAEGGFLERAVAQQRHAVAKNPQEWTAHSDLAKLLAEQDRRSASQQGGASAIRAMYQALERHPTSAVLHEYLGFLYAEQRDWANAAKHYKRALDCDEDKKLDRNHQWPDEHRRQVEEKLETVQKHLADGQ